MKLYENEKIADLKEPYDGYQITSFGRVIGKRLGKELKHSKDNNGYSRVRLYVDGKPKDIRVHKLVAEYFIPNPNNLSVVNHKDGVKNNPHIDNLEWCTAAENNQHAHQTGLTNVKGSNHGQSKINEDEAKQIIEMIKQGLSPQQIIINIPNATKSIVGHIKNKNRWKHLEW